MLRAAGFLCCCVGGALMVLDLVGLFVHIELVNRANVGTGLLMVTVGLIASHVARGVKP